MNRSWSTVYVGMLIFILLWVNSALSQNEGIGNTTSSPIPGVPHDYITGLNEIVNPANGAVSIRIPQPYPHERNPNFPRYAFMYDSNSVAKVPFWQTTDLGGGTSATDVIAVYYGISPTYAGTHFDTTFLSACVPNGPNSCTTYTCTLYSNYVQLDPDGGRHGLGLQQSVNGQGGAQSCAYFQVGSDQLWGGDDQYKATLVAGGAGAVTAWDLNGNTFVTPTSGNLAAPTLQEDPNGNFNDTTGRTAPLPSADTVNTSTTSLTFTVNYRVQDVTGGGSNDGCVGFSAITPGSTAGTSPAFNPVTSVTLPNGQSYTFQYDPAYKLLNKITYPTGATVTYTWSTIPFAEGVQYRAQNFVSGVGGLCALKYDWFAITKRVVSFDGVNNAQEQDFSYSTVWPATPSYKWISKSTTVITKDLIRGTQFSTLYTYSPAAPPATSFSVPTDLGYMPVENTISYYDFSGSLLKTVTKVWNSITQLKAECETLPNGQISGKFYTYQSYTPTGWLSYDPGKTTALPTDIAEYDYGAVTTACVQPGSVPTRETVTTYKAFANTPLVSNFPSLLDRPAKEQVYGNVNNTSTLLQETDYAYDETAPATANPTPFGHDEVHYGAGMTPPRGNPTTITKLCLVGGTSCTNSVTHYSYDTTGQRVSVTDANGNITQFSYADNYTTDDGSPSQNTNAYLTKITAPTTNGKSHITQFKYGFEDGRLRQKIDENNQTTTYCFKTGGCSSGSGFDPFVRLTGVNYPDGGQSTFVYNDAGPSPSLTSCQLINGTPGASCSAASPASGWKTTFDTYDGIGHVVQTKLVSDPDGATATATTYDGLGRTYKNYNPTRCPTPTTNCGTETTWGVTTYTYDALRRTTLISQADGSTITTSYSSNQTTVMDEVGNQRKSQTDALGRLTRVWEDPGTSPHLNYETDYQYDALGNLICAVEKGTDTAQFSNCSSAPATWRPRSFTYDGLSQLLTASNPESGMITYTYDADGNLASKIAPKAGQTGTSQTTSNYSYDVLNRLTQKSYVNPSAGTVKYGYDGISLTGCSGPAPPPITGATNLVGRRSAMCSAQSATTWSYDSLGRSLLEKRTNRGTVAKTYTVGYTYFKDGSLNTLTYPSGDVVTYNVGGAGRTTSVKDSVNNYAMPNFPCPGCASVQQEYAPFGGLGAIYLAETSTAAMFLQQTYNSRLQLDDREALASQPFFWRVYNYHPGAGDNGNVFGVTDNIDSTRSTTYSYDSLNRIKQANTTTTTGANCWGEIYSIDAWGDLTNRSGVPGMTGCTYESLGTTASTKNQLAILTYDAAGNVTNDSNGNQPTYDTENRISTDAGVTYYYDADGTRIEKSSGTMYWPGPSGTLAETDLSGTINEEYIFFNGERIARVDRPSGAVHYYFSDPLGSASVITDTSGNMQEQYYYYPYGGMKSASGSDPNHYKFTGKERDSESGLDDFEARHYASTMGRFMQPDPVGGHNEDPQTLNRYAYVRNNPLSLTDPTGLDFYLSCQKASDTCQKDAAGNLVQGTTTKTTDANGNTTSTFNPTVVTSASLQDPNSGNTGTVNQNGVQITSNGQTSEGIFINGTPSADLKGSGKLEGFLFNINGSDEKSGNLDYGNYTYTGSRNQSDVVKLLGERGAFTYGPEKLFGNYHHEGELNFRFSSGAHPNLFNYGPSLHILVSQDPKATVPVGPGYKGNFHVDSKTGPQHLACAEKGIGCTN